MTEVCIIGSGSVGWHIPTACACFSVRAEGHVLLLDLGPGAILSSVVHRLGFDIREVDTIFFSHVEHPDHSGDLPSLLFSMNYLAGPETFHARSKPLRLLGPGIGEFLGRVLAAFPRCSPKAMKIDTTDLTPTQTIDLSDRLSITVTKAVHSVEALCARIRCGEKVLAYSGDTAPCEGLRAVLQDADLAIVECSYPGASGSQKSHMTAPEVGRVAQAAKVNRLLLTHRFPFATDERLLAEVATEFSGTVQLAHPGQRIEL